MKLKDQISLDKLPKHIAIIMDGNGRWAKEKGKLRVFGHQQGVESVRSVLEACVDLSVPYLTLYAFSTENWNRPKIEVAALMELLVSSIHRETKTMMKHNIRLEAIGNLSLLPARGYQQLQKAIQKTAANTGTTLILALSYSAREEITHAARKLAAQVEAKTLAADAIDEHLFEQNLYTHAFPDPELLIRTSGEKRISNFLLWQLAYTELYFTETRWPDFKAEDLYQAILDFQNRERRFGLTSEQIEAINKQQ